MKNTIWVLLLFCMAVTSVRAEYEDEFSIDGNTCTHTGLLQFTDRNIPATVYSCCTVGTCTTIIFDEHHARELNEGLLNESFKIMAVQRQISNESLQGLRFGQASSICNYFGFKALSGEVKNVAADNVDIIYPFVSSNTKRALKTAKVLGKSSGLISEADPAILITSVVCTGLNHKETTIVNDVVDCQVGISLAENGLAHIGLGDDIERCINTNKIAINEYKSSILGTIKRPVDKAFTIITGAFTRINNPAATLNENTIFDDIDRAENAFDGMHVDYSSTGSDMRKVSAFFSRLKNTAAANYSTAKNKLDLIDEEVPGRISVFLHNLIYEPNLNYTLVRELRDDAKKKISTSKSDFTLYRFVSSQSNSINASVELDDAMRLHEIEHKKLEEKKIVIPFFR